MPENGHENCTIFRDNHQHPYSVMESESGLDFSTYGHIEVEDSALSCSFSKEVVGVDQFFADPKVDRALGIDFLHMEQESSLNFSEFEELSSSNVFGLETHFGILDTNTAQGVKDGMNVEFSDEILHGVQGKKDLFLTKEILSICPNYLCDTGFPEKSSLLYYPTADHSSLQKVDSECHLQKPEIGCNAAEMSDLSKAIVLLPDPTPDQNTSFLDNMSLDELHEAFKSTFGRDTFINDKDWLKRRIMFGLQSIKELDDDASIKGSKLSSTENDDDALFFSNLDEPERVYGSLCEIHDDGNLIREKNLWGEDAENNVGANCQSGSCSNEPSKMEDRNDVLTTKKRLRKPTRRYIEELSEKKSRNFNEKVRPCSSVSCSNDMRGQLLYQDVGMASLVHGETPMVLGKQFSSGALQSYKGRPRKNCSLLLRAGKGNKDLKPRSGRPKKSKNCELSESDSQDGFSVGFGSKIRKAGVRRKHHRQWTLTEVLKLVEGVSQYGVGRWTVIKRIHFSSSAYRTSVDLKDKWRNLLRATGAHLHGKKEVKPTKKHMSLPIPLSVTRRVRELSAIYPYPRQRKSGSQLTATTTSSNTDGSSLAR